MIVSLVKGIVALAPGHRSKQAVAVVNFEVYRDARIVRARIVVGAAQVVVAGDIIQGDAGVFQGLGNIIVIELVPGKPRSSRSEFLAVRQGYQVAGVHHEGWLQAFHLVDELGGIGLRVVAGIGLQILYGVSSAAKMHVSYLDEQVRAASATGVNGEADRIADHSADGGGDSTCPGADR